jgi:hypothetical protein
LSPIARRFAFAGMFVNAVAAKALLSIGNFVVSLILLRFGSDAQFGFYVLALNGVMLLVSIQSAFVCAACPSAARAGCAAIASSRTVAARCSPSVQTRNRIIAAHCH